MKLSLALRSHFGEIKLPGLVGAWMLAAFSVHCLFGGRAMGAALFVFSERIDHASPAFMGEGGHCGLIILARQHLIHAVYFVFIRSDNAALGRHCSFLGIVHFWGM